MGWKERLQAFRERHEGAESLLFFAAGFAFDAAVLRRIDEPRTMVQQGAYLLLIGGLLSWQQRDHHRVPAASGWLSRHRLLVDNTLHFLLGTMLNAYSIFYFHSASGLTAVGVLALAACCLAINELPRFRALGGLVLFALYSLCLTSYFAYLIPVLAGHLGRWMFYSAVLLALVPLSVQSGLLWRWTGNLRLVLEEALAPALVVQLAFVLAYALRLAPPVPLAMKEMGIYHDVRKEPGGRRLFREQPPTWRFWQKGDQEFHERPGDRVYCFARVFAPRHFHDQIAAVWFHDDPGQGWRQVYQMPLRISASSDRGFATDAFLTSPAEGAWRVELQTEDGYTIGTLDFTVTIDSGTEPRTFTEEFSPAAAGPRG